ncbi:nucleotide exchange factor GrpE [Pikeienuella piscinae]|uniref:Protein GrpE n=2 Tax=Pikeienuella piscinae TaxID=2748098 RepID=A0A7M3T7I1_9RHOB|nr:nucleotide exchange factor GrpE [Pikeienuella piscinae]
MSGATEADEAETAMEAGLGEDGEPTDPQAAEIIALTAERDELREKLMRALAEAENIRRRAERDRKDAEAFGGAKLARDLLSVHDNLARALAAADDKAREQAAGLIEGVELTQRELLAAFAKHRIEVVEPEIGEKFNPNLHQAMFEAEVPGAPPGGVIEVMQSGFTIASRLLRPAMVGVAKAPENGAPAQGAENDSRENDGAPTEPTDT